MRHVSEFTCVFCKYQFSGTPHRFIFRDCCYACYRAHTWLKPVKLQWVPTTERNPVRCGWNMFVERNCLGQIDSKARAEFWHWRGSSKRSPDDIKTTRDAAIWLTGE
jgi:hypothetical protein